jgi:hypothetical protein
MSNNVNALPRMGKVTEEIRALKKRVQLEAEDAADMNENSKRNFYGKLKEKANSLRSAVNDLETVLRTWASGGRRKTRKAKRKARKTRRR